MHNRLCVARLLLTGVSLFSRTVRGAPLANQILESTKNSADPHVLDLEQPIGASSEVLVRASASALLVLLGGVFAGLTIGLMGQDEVYLQVTAETGNPSERKHATRVLRLLARGKHWVLVTLLLANVVTNETLPIVLDRLLGGGWPAIVSSTAAIVVFGEIIPQSICVRYGLPLGAYFAPFVQCLMYLMYPLAVPIAKLLDKILGQDHGTIYKKAGLKSLVTLHHHMGIERLNEDEVTIISAVLDLKDKPVSKIMTPIDNVFVLSSDTVLDEKMVEKILLTGFNRIPIHMPDEPMNFIGMLLVRTLITYDPDDSLPISSFSLATLPETSPETSCLNILNYFQEGKSHMVAVSTNPGAVYGTVGVVTLEDVIEELIGEEIVDESDVYVDVHRAIRRVTPAPMLSRTLNAKASQIANQQMVSTLRPSNMASDPKATLNSKITIKRALQPSSLTQSAAPSQNPNPSSTSSSLPHAYLSTQTIPVSKHDDLIEFERTGDHQDDDQNLAELARSPGYFVTKKQDIVDVAATEHGALESNLGPDGVTKTAKISGKKAESDGDESRATFSESVVRVNGMNKVVIAEVSSDDESNDTQSINNKHQSWNSRKSSNKK